MRRARGTPLCAAHRLLAGAALCLSACAAPVSRSARPPEALANVAAAAGATSAPSSELVAKSVAVSVSPVDAATPAQIEADKNAVHRLCAEIGDLYRHNKWGPSPCESIPFKVIGYTVERRPMVAFETGAIGSPKLTLIQCGIHGDELPSLAMCLKLIQEIMDKRKSPPPGHRLIIQPLLNADGMLGGKPTRHNSRGVDINRNFPTNDWARDAEDSWKKKDHGDLRKFPGHRPNSEPETAAIVDFIARDRPQKIISIHTPLGFLDLDSKGGPDVERRAKFLAINMSKNSGNYRFKSFGFYPGSLGNYAGRERQIPVYTLELPPGDVSRPTIDHYWSRFRVALWRAIKFDLDTGQFSED